MSFNQTKQKNDTHSITTLPADRQQKKQTPQTYHNPTPLTATLPRKKSKRSQPHYPKSQAKQALQQAASRHVV
jgi:hypothetical protein